jgi:hypothetical protein
MDLGPIGDQMAEDLEYPAATGDAAGAAAEAEDGGKPIRARCMQELAQTKQQLQHAEQVMQAQHGELEGKQAEIASKEKIAQMEIDSARSASPRSIAKPRKSRSPKSAPRSKDAALFLRGTRTRRRAYRRRGGAGVRSTARTRPGRSRSPSCGQRPGRASTAHQVGMAAAGASAAADAQQTGTRAELGSRETGGRSRRNRPKRRVMPADLTADLNLLDAQLTTLIGQVAVVVTATAASTTQPMVDNLNTTMLAIGATRARLIRARQQP